MTDHPSDVELSALLDDEATADVAAHVERCAPCDARRSALEEAARALRSAPPVDPVRRERAIAAALQVMDEGSVRPLPSRGDRLPPRALAAAAALVVLAGIGIGLAAGGSGGGGDEDGDDHRSQAATGAAAAEESAADAAGTSAAGPAWLGDLGTVDDGVRAALERAGTGTGGSTTLAAPPPVPCEDAAKSEGGRGLLESYGTGTRHAREVGVLVFRDGERAVAVVVSPTTCEVLQVEEL